MKLYYIVPEGLALQHNGRTDGVHGLSFTKDIQNRWVVNTDVADLWPDIDWQSMPQEELSREDFPVNED